MAHPPPRRPVESAPGISWSFSTESVRSLNLGYRVSFANPGYIVQAGWLQLNGDAGPHGAFLSAPGGPLLKVVAFLPSPETVTEGEAVWIRRNIKPGWRVESGVQYEFGVWFSTIQYAYAYSVLDSAPLTDGVITIPQNDPSGESASLFAYAPAFWNDFTRGEGTLYGVDLSYQPS